MFRHLHWRTSKHDVKQHDRQLYQNIQALKDHGSSKKYYHDYIGHNYRMEGLQGAILNIKLKYLEKWTREKRKNVWLYNKYLSKPINPHEDIRL